VAGGLGGSVARAGQAGGACLARVRVAKDCVTCWRNQQVALLCFGGVIDKVDQYLQSRGGAEGWGLARISVLMDSVLDRLSKSGVKRRSIGDARHGESAGSQKLKQNEQVGGINE